MSYRTKYWMNALAVASVVGLTACNGPGQVEGEAKVAQDQVTGTQQEVPAAPEAPNPPASAPTPALGETCNNGDSGKVCLSLKYVVYKNASGSSIVSEALALSNLTTINEIWSQCKIGFEIGEFVVVNPTEHGLVFNTSALSQLTSIRREFENDSTMLVVTTGNWSGTLGAGSANAYAEFPSGDPRGVVLEQEVADYPNIIAHELGHALNLSHVSDSTDVMSALIYSTSKKLTASQCTAARNAASHYFTKMMR